MVSSSTFEAGCASTQVWGSSGLSVWACIGNLSSSPLISWIESSVPIKACPVDVHWYRDIVHTPRCIGRIVVIRPCLVRMVALEIVSVIAPIVIWSVTSLEWSETSSLLIVRALEVSKCSSPKSQTRDKGGSISLGCLIGLRSLMQDVLQQLLGPCGLDSPFFHCWVIHGLWGF